MPKCRVLLLAALLGAVAFGGVAALRAKPAQPGAGAPAERALEFLADDILAVAPARLERSLALTGTLAALNEATLKAKVAGELLEVAAREGQEVRRGRILARIDATEVRARVAAREAEVEAARAQLALAEKTQATQSALLAQRFISQNAFDATQSGFEVAAARLRSAQAELAVANKSLEDAVLRAPFDGSVAQRHARPGERVALDAKVISIVDLSRLELAASLPAAHIGLARVGQRVALRVEGYGERVFEGRIERINPSAASGSRAFEVYAVIANPDRALRAGMFAQGALALERIEDALVIPSGAVREEGGRSWVYVVTDDVLRRRTVQLGAADSAERVQVLEGLRAGERIVKRNLGALREGAPVRIAASAAERAAAR